jgi:CBS domain-containing protein
MDLQQPITRIMTSTLTTVGPLDLMTDVASIFDSQKFNHLPVIDDKGIPIGIISRHDYNQFQHHFTRKGWLMATAANKRLFESMTAKEAMTENPKVIDASATIASCLDHFLDNQHHSLLVVENDKCVGIVTPRDFLKLLKWNN